MMPSRDEVEALFDDRRRSEYDFSHAPALVTRKGELSGEISDQERAGLKPWAEIQERFIDRSKQPDRYSDGKVKSTLVDYGAFFEKRGPLCGNVLDIGGGWGLYREWWQPDESHVYVVHDPGVERLTQAPPHASHRRHFRRGFTLPMVFVEGLGEDLPYRTGVFDTCLVAATLDHCIDPQGVFAAAHRCLRPGGSMLAIESCARAGNVRNRLQVAKRALRLLRSPKRLMARWSDPPIHLHYFKSKDLVTWMEQAGFHDVRVSEAPVRGESIYAFEGTKAGA